MEIKLYYVEGISKEDTPFFSSASEQTRYFESHKELTIETTWYPPYYNNVINTDQLTINNKVNYLSFKYQGHTFYYFINSTNYIADGLIDLNIELDYIQTYMFNMSFTSTIIDREHINRWKRGALSTMVFNRDYLRDNNSRGNFILTNKKIYDTDDIPSTNSFKPQGWLVINYSSAFSELGTIRRTRWKNTNLKNNLVTPYYQVLYPIGEDFTEVAMYSQGSSPQLGVTYDLTSIPNMISKAQISSIFFVPFTPFNGTDIGSYNYGNRRIPLLKNTAYLNTIYTSQQTAGYISNPNTDEATGNFFTLESTDIKFEDITSDLPQFVVNRNTLNQFDLKYIPALCDENYYRVEFGESNYSTTFPLYQTDRLNLIGVYYCDMITGYRYYYITTSTAYNLGGNLDKYGTLIQSNTPTYVPALNNAWNDYVANNLGNMVMGGIQTGTNMVMSAFGGAGVSFASSISSAGSKTGRKAKKLSVNEHHSTTEGYHSGFNVGGLIGEASGALGEYGSMMNAMFKPNTVKTTGSYYADLLSNNCRIHRATYVVDDIEQVGRFYQKYGYLTGRHISNEVNLNDLVTNTQRYYFNYIKLSNCNAHLNVLETDEVTDGIRDRMVSGIRFWHVGSSGVSIGVYTYDNVETAYLS